jgi:tetratricopeptide (TPR) repeat protein
LTGTGQSRRLSKHPCIAAVPGEKQERKPSLSRWQEPMSETKSFRGKSWFAAGLYFSLILGTASGLGGQELPLKRDLPGTDSISCAEIDPNVQPSPEEVEQASRLGSDSEQALMVGDQERARDLLARATELDPTSAELAYRYGRILESLGEVEPAIDQFCRALGLGSREQGIGDARPRLEALSRAREPELPEAARSEFLNGLLQADLGNMEGAEEAFGAAFGFAPDWADAVYNRGIIRIRLENPDMAVEDLQQYLILNPNGADAILVSQRIGQLQIRQTSSVSPGTALGLGIPLPGMGQFYSGRALGGMTVLALAGGALAAGFLIEEIDVKCVGSAPSSGECPADRVVSEDTSNPYMIHGIIAAGVISIAGAVEAYIKAKRGGDGAPGEIVAFRAGKARIAGPTFSATGPRLNINLVKVAF